MHFWVLTARVYARFSVPRKIGLNWFIPAFVNSRVGSSCGTTGELGTNVCPCRSTKKSMNCRRISEEVMVVRESSDEARRVGRRGRVPDYSRTPKGGQGEQVMGRTGA